MKKHSHQEILVKLDQAAELARLGKTQVEVCQALGVSVMTYHRWRKLPMVVKTRDEALTIVPEQIAGTISLDATAMARHLEELTIENRRLRKIVTDLLLEKMRLEETAAAVSPALGAQKAVAEGV